MLGAASAQTGILGAARAQVGTVLAPPHHFCPLWPVIHTTTDKIDGHALAFTKSQDQRLRDFLQEIPAFLPYACFSSVHSRTHHVRFIMID